MKPVFKNLKQITGFLLVLIVAFCVFAQDKLNCPKITKDQRPAVVFMESSGLKTNLYVGYFKGKAFVRKKLLTSKYVRLEQLNNTVFLVTPHEGEREIVYAFDFGKGRRKLLTEDPGVVCLRSEPKRGKAILADSGRKEIYFWEFDLETLKMTPRPTIKTESLKGWRRGMRLSPDFKRIAYMGIGNETHAKALGGFSLRILDLSTTAVSELVDGIQVTVSKLSSSSSAMPAFEWISDDEIIYVDMPGSEGIGFGDVLNVVSRVNVRTGEVSEVVRKKLPVRTGGVSFRVNPFDGRIICNEKFVLDLEKKTLVERDLPFSVEPDYFKEPVVIRYGDIVLYESNGYCNKTWISDSGENFAWILGYKTTLPSRVLHAKFKGRDRSVKIAEGDYPTRIVGWIE